MSNSFNWKFYIFIRLSGNVIGLLITWSTSSLYMKYIITFFDSCMYSRETTDIFPYLKKTNFNVGFFSDMIKARSFKLCMIITLLQVCFVILGLMTLTLFQGTGVSETQTANCHVFDSCPLYFKHCKVATYIKKIVQNMICVTLVCTHGRLLAHFWLVKCLGLSKALMLGFFQTP